MECDVSHKGHSASPEGSSDMFQIEARSQAASERWALRLTPTCGSIIFSELSVYRAPKARASSILGILGSRIKNGFSSGGSGRLSLAFTGVGTEKQYQK